MKMTFGLLACVLLAGVSLNSIASEKKNAEQRKPTSAANGAREFSGSFPDETKATTLVYSQPGMAGTVVVTQIVDDKNGVVCYFHSSAGSCVRIK